MKFEVIEVAGQAGLSCGEALKKKLNGFKQNVKIISMCQSSFLLKTGTPCTIFTICYDEPGEPNLKRLG